MHRTRKITKPLVAGLAITALLFSASGCAGPAESAADDEAVSNVAEEQVVEDDALDTDCVDDDYGNVAIGELVEDELGEYCKIRVSSEQLEYDPSVVNLDMLEEAGWSEEDAKTIWEDGMTFTVEEVIDSQFLEKNPSPELNAEVVGAYEDRVDPEWMDLENSASELVINNLPIERRDGKPRIIFADLSMYEITALNGNPTMNVRGHVFYPVDPDASVEFLETHLETDVPSPKLHLAYFEEQDLWAINLYVSYGLAYSKTEEGFKWGGANRIYRVETMNAE